MRTLYTAAQSASRDRLAAAVSRWEDEGGAPADVESDPPQSGAPAAGGQRVLVRLGAAVLLHWSELPTSVRRTLFEQAVTDDDPARAASLRTRIAKYLHAHGNENVRVIGPV